MSDDSVTAMKTIVLSLVAIAAGALSIGCSVDMKGSFEGKCSVSTLGREDAGKVKKTCTIEATESERVHIHRLSAYAAFARPTFAA
jgi:hypothetical protein